MAELDQSAPPARSMKTFYLLILVFVLPFTMAVLLHFFDLKPSGKSYGNLIVPPKILQFSQLKDAQGEAFASQQWLKKWTVVMVDSTGCDKPCQAQVHLLKQVHTSLNKEIKRVQRVLLLPTAATAQAANDLQKQYPDLIILAGNEAEINLMWLAVAYFL
jgi:cytochrome oxidase Cu insertion factor (SCO1/SenC/PrrC family)